MHAKHRFLITLFFAAYTFHNRFRGIYALLSMCLESFL